MKRIAVVLLNLGGPDSLSAVKKFLFNFFRDHYIINLPNPFRFFIALLISTTRASFSRSLYSQIGGKSHILEYTKEQAKALAIEIQNKKRNNFDLKIFVCMRYWHPMSSEVAERIKQYDPEEIIYLPMYPQFSTTTSQSSLDNIQNAVKTRNVTAKEKIIGCYFDNPKFIDAHVALLKESLLSKSIDSTILLFSAHALPLRIIEAGDPYQWQIEQTVFSIMNVLDIQNLEYTICYQSKLGPLKWLEPRTDVIIKEASMNGKNIVVIPVAFVSEHVETLVELDIEYKEIASRFGAISYTRVPTVYLANKFIEGLADLVLKAIDSESLMVKDHAFCPNKFTKCICSIKNDFFI